VAEPDYIRAHSHSSRHRRELEASEKCGCFYCLAEFPPGEVANWLNEGDGTALCPHCAVDSVIGSTSGYPITAAFLARMHRHWFAGSAG
jgi:hypothetical protein